MVASSLGARAQVRETLAEEGPLPDVVVEAPDPVRPVVSSPRGAMIAGDLAAAANARPRYQRAGWAERPEALSQWSSDAVRTWIFAEEARATGLADDPAVREEIDRILARAYAVHLVGPAGSDAISRPSDADIQRYYDANLDTFTCPARVRAQVIVFSQRQEAERQAVRLRRASERRFGAIAKRISLDRASRARGGSVGWVSMESAIDPALFSALMALEKDGHVSPVIASEAGDRFYVARRQERQEARPFSLDEVRETIASRMQAESRARILEERAATLASRPGWTLPALEGAVRVRGTPASVDRELAEESAATSR